MVRFLIHRAAAPARALALSPATTSATAATAARLVRPRAAVVLCRALSDGMGGGGSVTYSGGHASSGQGGFYGSGGARANKESGAVQQAGAVAQLEDTNALREAMAEVALLEEQLSTVDDAISTRSIELKAAIKKRMTAPQTVALLNRLVISGAPVWGLSQTEREMVSEAIDKMNSV